MCFYVGEREGYGSFTIVLIQTTHQHQTNNPFCLTLRIYQRYQCSSSEKRKEEKLRKKY